MAKSVLGVPHLDFPGHLVTAQAIIPLDEKVRDIRNFPQRNVQRQLREFLGLINFYYCFIHNCAAILPQCKVFRESPATKSKQELIWDDEATPAFAAIRKPWPMPSLPMPMPSLPVQAASGGSSSPIWVGGILGHPIMMPFWITTYTKPGSSKPGAGISLLVPSQIWGQHPEKQTTLHARFKHTAQSPILRHR